MCQPVMGGGKYFLFSFILFSLAVLWNRNRRNPNLLAEPVLDRIRFGFPELDFDLDPKPEPEPEPEPKLFQIRNRNRNTSWRFHNSAPLNLVYSFQFNLLTLGESKLK
jgi:hypothetical protein